MIAAADENGVKLTIGLVCRYHGTHSVVREIVQSGELGATRLYDGASHRRTVAQRVQSHAMATGTCEVWWESHGNQCP